MKIGDKVKIKTGKRGRPTFGEVIELMYQPDDAVAGGWPMIRVATKRGPELYKPSELEVIVETNG